MKKRGNAAHLTEAERFPRCSFSGPALLDPGWTLVGELRPEIRKRVPDFVGEHFPRELSDVRDFPRIHEQSGQDEQKRPSNALEKLPSVMVHPAKHRRGIDFYISIPNFRRIGGGCQNESRINS